MLQELLQYQGRIGHHYADGLDGCGLDLESRVRDAYYVLLRRLINAIRGTCRSSLSRLRMRHFILKMCIGADSLTRLCQNKERNLFYFPEIWVKIYQLFSLIISLIFLL